MKYAMSALILIMVSIVGIVALARTNEGDTRGGPCDHFSEDYDQWACFIEGGGGGGAIPQDNPRDVVGGLCVVCTKLDDKDSCIGVSGPGGTHCHYEPASGRCILSGLCDPKVWWRR